LLAAKLQHQRDEAAVQSLGLIGVAAAIVTLRGVVLAANDPFLSHDGVSISAYNRLRIQSASAAKLLDAALERLAADALPLAPMSIAVPAAENEASVVLHVLPVKGRARDIFGATTVLVIVTALGTNSRRCRRWASARKPCVPTSSPSSGKRA
jgi:hypothetical protein